MIINSVTSARFIVERFGMDMTCWYPVDQKNRFVFMQVSFLSKGGLE